MDRKMAYGMFWIFFLAIVLREFTSAAAPLSTLTCNVSQQADGFSYRLARPPRSSECKTCWELKNKTVIARNSDFDKQRVGSLTNQSLSMKECQPYLRYTSDCPEVWEEAHCEINCSHILDLKDNLKTTVNSTLICITESWCLTEPIFGLGVIFIGIIVVGVLVALLRCNNCKCRRRESATTSVSYTLANGKNNMELEEMGGVTVKTGNRS